MGRHSTAAKKIGRGCPLLVGVILYSGRSFWDERFVRCPEFILEVVASRTLQMYYRYGIFNP